MPFSQIPDNYDIWLAHEERKDRALRSRPLCSCCENHIQEYRYFEIDGKPICPDCMETYFRKELD